MTTYRCGYCGQRTDKQGYPLAANELVTEDDYNKAELVYGYCCYDEFERPQQIDACDPSFEGTYI